MLKLTFFAFLASINLANWTARASPGEAVTHAAEVCVPGQFASTACGEALESLTVHELNIVLTIALDAAQELTNARPLEAGPHYLTTLVSAHTLLNASWEALYAAALNAAANATSPELCQATINATLKAANQSEWATARKYINSGSRRLVLASWTKQAMLEADTTIVDPVFAAAVPASWRQLQEAAQKSLAPAELGEITFEAAQKVALKVLIKNMPQMWQLTYDSMASSISREANQLQYFMIRWPLPANANTVFAPYAKIIKKAEAR